MQLRPTLEYLDILSAKLKNNNITNNATAIQEEKIIQVSVRDEKELKKAPLDENEEFVDLKLLGDHHGVALKELLFNVDSNEGMLFEPEVMESNVFSEAVCPVLT
jgi:preprotein translocase subunit SecD